MNRRKTFFDTHVSYLVDTPLYLVDKKNGVITNALYKGDENNTLFFRESGNEFLQMVKIRNWNCYILKTKNYYMTPSKAYAKELAKCIVS